MMRVKVASKTVFQLKIICTGHHDKNKTHNITDQLLDNWYRDSDKNRDVNW